MMELIRQVARRQNIPNLTSTLVKVDEEIYLQ